MVVAVDPLLSLCSLYALSENVCIYSGLQTPLDLNNIPCRMLLKSKGHHGELGVKNCSTLGLNFLQVNVFFQSFCFPTERHHLSKHTAQ